MLTAKAPAAPSGRICKKKYKNGNMTWKYLFVTENIVILDVFEQK